MSADGETRHRLQEKVDDAYLALRIQKSKGKKTTLWASANVQLAEALTALAHEEDDRDAFGRYEQAMRAYRKALEVFSSEEHLGEWGGTVVSFARALRSYAAREGGHMSLLRLDHATRLLSDVIAAMPEKRGLFDCAMLHIELAYVCRTKSSIDREERRLEHLHNAVTHFEQAAHILRMKESFDNWAIAVVGQATVWRDIATLNRADALSALNKASELLKAILNYYTAKTHPIDWVFSNFEYGRIWLRIALHSQGEHCHNGALKAIGAFRTALTNIVMDSAPDLWVRLQTELALALTTLASVSESDEAIKYVEEACALYRTLSNWYDEQEDYVGAALMQANLGKELGKLASLAEGERVLFYRMRAVEALRRSAPAILEQEMSDDWLTNMFELSSAIHSLTHNHDLPEGERLREEALLIYRNTIKRMNMEKNPAPFAMLQSWLGLALSWLGERDEGELGLSRLREAELCFRLALSLRDEKEDTSDFIRLENNLANLFYILARRSLEPQAKDYCDQALRSILRAKDLADRRTYLVEWCNIQSNYAMILLHRIRRDLSPHPLEECEQAALAFRAVLDAAEEGQVGLVSQLLLQRNLALLLLLWARRVLPQEAYPLYVQAQALLQEIRQRITEGDLKNMADLVRDVDLQELEAAMEDSRPNLSLKRFLQKLRQKIIAKN